MVTATERTELRGWVGGQGIDVEIIDRRAPKAEWWRASDGKYLGTLPADPYHLKLYRAKGFVLVDPGFRSGPEPPADFKGFWERQQAAVAPTEPKAPSVPDLSKYTHSCGWIPRADSKNLGVSLNLHKRRCKESTDGD